MIDAMFLCALLPVMLFLSFMLGKLWEYGTKEYGTKEYRIIAVAILVFDTAYFCYRIFTLC